VLQFVGVHDTFVRMFNRAILTHADAPTIFRIAGFDTQKSQWISGLNNIFYAVRFLFDSTDIDTDLL